MSFAYGWAASYSLPSLASIGINLMSEDLFQAWSKTSPLARQQVMFKYQALIKENLKDIAKLITLEQGKTLPDAEGDVMRGLQVTSCFNLRSYEQSVR